MALYNYEIGGSATTGTGTVSTTASSTTVEGSGTSFVTELDVGDLITVNSVTRVIASITDADTLDVSENFTATQAGETFTYVDLTNVESLTYTPPAPKGTFKEYSRYIPLGDGTVRGAGWSEAAWRWGYLTSDQREDLKAYCSGASAAVHIRTRKDDSDAFGYFSGTMIWPQEEPKDHSKRLDFAVAFQNLTEISVS